MRIAVLVLALAGSAAAQPNRDPEIDRLDQEYARTQDPTAQAAILRKLYAVERKLSGDDSIATSRRKVSLAATLLQIGETSESVRLFEELLASAEKQHGPNSREAMHSIQSLLGAYQVARSFDRADPRFQ